MTPLHPDSLIVEDIGRSAATLADLADGHDLSTPVATCGDWKLADLVWHLTEVQLFWIHVIGNRPEGPETYDRATRPSDHELAATLRSAGSELVSLLESADADDPAWSWSDDHTVGFTVRRQIHESLVHVIDGLLAAELALPDVPPLLAADGVDEIVGVMLTGTPPWASFQPNGKVAELRATDTGDRWVLRPGVVAGTEPTSGKQLELDGYELDPAAAPDVSIAAPAIDLLLWMWGRRSSAALESGADSDAANLLRRTIVGVTQ